MKRFISLFLLVSLLQAPMLSAWAQCDPDVEVKLKELDVAPSSIEKITIMRDSTQEGGLQGYQAWVGLNQCRGFLVIDLTPYCLVTSVYTWGTCRVPGVDAY